MAGFLVLFGWLMFMVPSAWRRIHPMVVAVMAVLIGLGLVLSPAARADDEPGPPLPSPDESAACTQAWTSGQDPRVNMHYGLGAVMYAGWVQAQCSGPDAKFPNGALVAGSGVAPVLAPWQQLPTP